MTPRPPLRSLNVDDTARLEALAPSFAIEFLRTKNADFSLRNTDDPNRPALELSERIAHQRLLTEICSKAAPWVYFHLGEHCATSLLKLNDTQLLRVAELFRNRDGLPGEPLQDGVAGGP